MTLFLAGALRFLRGLPWQVWAALAAGLLAWYVLHLRAELVEVRGEYASYVADVTAKTKAASDAARESERLTKAGFDALTKDYRESRHAVDARDAVIAGLRAGRVKLRDEWSCPSVADRLPGAAATAAGSDPNAGLREASAGRIVQVGRDADEEVKFLQGLLALERAKH